MNIDKKLADLKNSVDFMNLYTQGMSYLERSGILQILKELGKCAPANPQHPNYMQETMFNAAFSIGYTKALDDLYDFRERFLGNAVEVTPEPEYGGFDSALANGDLTEEEIDAIRSGSTVTYAIPDPVRKPQ